MSEFQKFSMLYTHIKLIWTCLAQKSRSKRLGMVEWSKFLKQAKSSFLVVYEPHSTTNSAMHHYITEFFGHQLLWYVIVPFTLCGCIEAKLSVFIKIPTHDSLFNISHSRHTHTFTLYWHTTYLITNTWQSTTTQHGTLSSPTNTAFFT